MAPFQPSYTLTVGHCHSSLPLTNVTRTETATLKVSATGDGLKSQENNKKKTAAEKKALEAKRKAAEAEKRKIEQEEEKRKNQKRLEKIERQLAAEKKKLQQEEGTTVNRTSSPKEAILVDS